jgi:uncharacterized damage-inducible protein DinB
MLTPVEQLVFLLDQAFDHKAWHGTNLRGSLRGLTVDDASWRPGRGRHNIWEIALHTAYWKYAVRRRLLGEKRGSFALKGNNWFPRSARDGKNAWRSDVALLEEEHAKLREAITALAPESLTSPAAGGETTVLALITGIASHDLYHAGQIQILKRLQGVARG